MDRDKRKMSNTKTKKIKSTFVKTTGITKETRNLFSKSIGVLFVYTILFAIFRDNILFPITRKLWSLSLKTVEEGFITDQNFTAIFTHPLVLIAGLIAIVGYAVLSLWETAGIVLILEYSYLNKPVSLFKAIYKSFLQIRHCLKPKNWVVFLYLLLVQPIVDSDFAGMMNSSLVMPEFIMDFIMARKFLAVLYVLVIVGLFVIFIRLLFIPYIMILEKKDYSKARLKNAGLLKGKYIATYLHTLVASFLGTFLLTLVPFLIMYALQFLLVIVFNKYTYVYEISEFMFGDVFEPILDTMRNVFVKVFVSAILLVLYHLISKESGYETEIVLPDDVEKTKGKIYSLKSFVYGAYLLIFVASSLLVFIFSFIAQEDPNTVAEILNQTQIAAHKGYSSIAPENTMPAFERAVECQDVDYIELDVRETKDGIPVVIHDESLLAATGMSMSVYDIDYEELNQLTACYGFKEGFEATRIPMLEEVLSQLAGKKDFIIEIKYSDRTPELPQKIVNLMEKYEITDDSVIHSGSYKALKAVKEINPDIRCGLIIAVSTGGYADLPYADFFSVEHTYISSNMIEQIHKRGKQVYVWTVNEENSFSQVRDMDADVLITDYPEAAYDGVHKYDKDLMDSLADEFMVDEIMNADELLDANEKNSTGHTDYNTEGDW